MWLPMTFYFWSLLVRWLNFLRTSCLILVQLRQSQKLFKLFFSLFCTHRGNNLRSKKKYLISKIKELKEQGTEEWNSDWQVVFLSKIFRLPFRLFSHLIIHLLFHFLIHFIYHFLDHLLFFLPIHSLSHFLFHKLFLSLKAALFLNLMSLILYYFSYL